MNDACRRPGSFVRQLLLVVVISSLGLSLLPGCGGCRKKDPLTDSEREEQRIKEEKERKQREEEAKKPPFEFHTASFLPSDSEELTGGIKPGHWGVVSQSILANRGDFNGRFACESVTSTGNPIELEDLPYALTNVRPLALPKKQLKTMEMLFFAPRSSPSNTQVVRLNVELQDRSGVRRVTAPSVIGTAMPNYQYNLVILSGERNRYGFVKSLPSVTAPSLSFSNRGPVDMHYRVVMPEVGQRIDLPSQPLAWTNIATLLWDDVDPGLLTVAQQEAMVDWLHWGGTLIISGPRSLDTLRASFLADYLPAIAGENRPLANDNPGWIELNNTWSISSHSEESEEEGNEILESPNQQEARPIDAVALELHREGAWVPSTGNLVVESHVGRGRIVVTSFSLADPKIAAWNRIDPFFNNCLLRRPAREWKPDVYEVGWASPFTNNRSDSRLTCNLRYFSRDAEVIVTGVTLNGDLFYEEAAIDSSPEPNPFMVETPGQNSRSFVTSQWNVTDPEHPFAGYRDHPVSGVGGWNDHSGPSEAARLILREAAGIEVPDLKFVLIVVSTYLFVLVPLNWLFFRLIGRVEWAWAAAPVIAIGGGYAVVHLAQINIGFAQSRTDIAVLELQSDYGRGHLTRYTTLYTSLATNYDVHFEDGSALALPFSTDNPATSNNLQRHGRAQIERAEGTRLTGIKVISNATGSLHSEQMILCAGGLRLEGSGSSARLVNDTQFDLHGTGLVRRNKAGRIQVVWVGDLNAGSSQAVTFHNPTLEQTLFAEWEEAPETARQRDPGTLSLRPLLDIAGNPGRILAGETCLLGWTETPFPGMKIEPDAKQHTALTLVVAHLQYGLFGEMDIDVNTPQTLPFSEEE